ncbi:MAG: alpha-L-fucosidase [Candidatus Hodarchaeota archaeon]
MIDKKEPLQKFIDMKFGMFIHFGLYSLGEEHEWHMHRYNMKKEAYAKEFIPRFNPDPKGMEQWVVTAKEMGAKYLTVTSKHHDGFCLWDSEVTRPIFPEYHIRSTPYYKNNQTGVIEKLYEACEKHDMKLGLYYSTIDWSFTKKPRFKRNYKYPQDPGLLEQYNTYYYEQCRELKKKFPKIFDIWFDGYQFGPEYPRVLRQKEVYAKLSEEFPDFLVASNPGCAAAYSSYKGTTDIALIENPGHATDVVEVNASGEGNEFVGELCFNLNRHWGFNANDKEYKSPEYVVNLIKAMNAQNVNVLLNFGPHWSGYILDEQVEIAKKIGNLLKIQV